MATRFEALDELLDDSLELPIQVRDGKVRTYRIPSPSAEDGLKIQRITTLATRLLDGGQAPDTQLLDDQEEMDLIHDALGNADEQMQADGVDWAWRRHAGLTAIVWITQGAEAAGSYWRAAGDPTRLVAPNREARRAAGKTGSAAAKSTKPRASTSGTSARPATKKPRKPAA